MVNLRCRYVLSLIVVSLGISLTNLALANQPHLPQRDFSRETPRRVLAVHAVDEIEVDLDGLQVRIKLVGIAGSRAGAASATTADQFERGRVFLDNLLRGESVYLEQEPDLRRSSASDNNERGIRALVYRAPDGLSINLELIRQGFVKHDARRRHRYLAVFAYYAATAREHERGLWAPKPDNTEQKPPDANNAGESTAEDVEKTQPSQKLVSSSSVVWITKSGTRYHTQDCYHHRGGNLTLTREEALRRGLKPCSHCKPDEPKAH